MSYKRKRIIAREKNKELRQEKARQVAEQKEAVRQAKAKAKADVEEVKRKQREEAMARAINARELDAGLRNAMRQRANR